MVSMLPICIYISLIFENCICDKEVQNSDSSRPGVDLNLEGFDFGDLYSTPRGAPSWMLNVRKEAFQRGGGGAARGFPILSPSISSGPHPKGECLGRS